MRLVPHPHAEFPAQGTPTAPADVFVIRDLFASQLELELHLQLVDLEYTVGLHQARISFPDELAVALVLNGRESFQ